MSPLSCDLICKYHKLLCIFIARDHLLSPILLSSGRLARFLHQDHHAGPVAQSHPAHLQWDYPTHWAHWGAQTQEETGNACYSAEEAIVTLIFTSRPGKSQTQSQINTGLLSNHSWKTMRMPQMRAASQILISNRAGSKLDFIINFKSVTFKFFTTTYIQCVF